MTNFRKVFGFNGGLQHVTYTGNSHRKRNNHSNIKCIVPNHLEYMASIYTVFVIIQHSILCH